MTNLIQKIIACEKNNSSVPITNALLWAGVMIAMGILLRGSEQMEAGFWIIFTAATASILLFSNNKEGKE